MDTQQVDNASQMHDHSRERGNTVHGKRIGNLLYDFGARTFNGSDGLGLGPVPWGVGRDEA
jgi:hypothetical protein